MATIAETKHLRSNFFEVCVHFFRFVYIFFVLAGYLSRTLFLVSYQLVAVK